MIKRQTLRILLAILFVVGTPLTMLAGKNIVLKTQEEYYLASISPNGEWACGMFRCAILPAGRGGERP